MLRSNSKHTVNPEGEKGKADQFRFSFVFLALPKIGPNRYT